MKRLFAVMTMSMLGLVACGPGAKIGGGKQGAAEALYGASKATSAGANKQTGGVDITGSISWSCPEGGTAELSGFSVAIDTTGGATVKQTFTAKYNDCGAAKSDQGVAKYNGSWNVTQSVITSANGVSVDQAFKGKVLVQGAFDDFVDADVTQSVLVSGLSSTTGSVSMTLKGTITTSAGTNTYNEEVNVTAGTLTADVSKK